MRAKKPSMSKFYLLLFLTIVHIFFSSTAFSKDFPVTATDALGVEVTLENPPQRIISLAPNNTEILFALGLEEKVMGVTRYCNYPPQVKNKPQVGGFSDFSLETILSLNPDLVLAIRGNPDVLLNSIREYGCPVFALELQSAQDVIDALLLVGELTDSASEAKQVSDKMKSQLEDIELKLKGSEPKKVYFGAMESPFFTCGGETFISNNIKQAGGENIFEDLETAWPSVSLEQIRGSDPEIIFPGMSGPPFGKTDKEEILAILREDEIWKHVSAVKSGNLFLINEDLVHRPGPRIIQGIEAMAKAIHPEVFKP